MSRDRRSASCCSDHSPSWASVAQALVVRLEKLCADTAVADSFSSLWKAPRGMDTVAGRGNSNSGVDSARGVAKSRLGSTAGNTLLKSLGG